jgi:sterol desaturase/sphingolipid hydroxylase (fatty acid hydroxylase superfamily)
MIFTGMHREMHMINIGWAGHAGHHSSEYLNLTTAARQSAFGQVIGWVSDILILIFFKTIECNLIAHF